MSELLQSPFRSSSRIAWPEILSLVMVLVCFAVAIHVTRDLSWPPRQDFHREMGSTQTILDGRPLEDPVLLGEVRWYNPLMPALMAQVCRSLDLPLNEAYTRLGPYFNLLTPLAFYLLAALLCGRWVAFASLAVHLFVFAPLLPPSAEGSYSPWLWTRNVMQGPAFLAVAAMLLAFRARPGVRCWLWSASSGILLGLVFVGHTAPALILVLYALIATGHSIFFAPARDRQVVGSLVRLAIMGFSSMAVSAPYLFPLLVRYQFEVLNKAPMHYVGLSILELAMGTVSLGFVLAIIGGWWLWRRPDRLGLARGRRAEVWILLLATLLPMGYGVLHQVLKHVGVVIPQLLPTYHFHIYLKDVEALFAGLGFAGLTIWASSRFGLQAAVESWPLVQRVGGSRVTLLVAAVVVGVGVQIPTYLRTADLGLFREESIAKANRLDMVELYDWVLANTDTQDVFLADDWFGFHAISAAARKNVAIYAGYTSPYVEFDSREADRLELYALLRGGEGAAFLDLARKYDLDFVVDADAAPDAFRLEPGAGLPLALVMEGPGIRLYAVE